MRPAKKLIVRPGNAFTRSAILASAIASAAPVARSQTWLSSGKSTWSNPVNWTSLPVSGASTSLFFPSSGVQAYTATNDIPGQFSFASMTFNGSSTLSVSVAGGSLSSFQAAAASSAINNSSAGSVFFNGALALSANPLTINVGSTSSGATTIGAVISGAGSIIVNNAGGGSVVLAAPNTFSGGVTLNSGQLLLGAQTSLGTGPLTANGGTLGTTFFPGNLGYPPFAPIFKNNFSTSGAGLTMGGPFQYSLAGNISGLGGVTLTPNSLFDSVWALSGTNSFLGPITINPSPTPGVADKLIITTPAALGNASSINVNGGSLGAIGFVGGSSTITINTPMTVGATGGAIASMNTITNTQLNYAGNITGGGSLAILGPGFTTLSGTNTFTGSLSLVGGTTIVGADSNLGGASTKVRLDGGSLMLLPSFGTTNRNVIVEAQGSTIYTLGDATFSNAMSNQPAQNVTKAGSGRLIFTGANTLNNTFTVNGGTLVAAGATGMINNSGTLIVTQGAAVMLDNTAGPFQRIGSTSPLNLNGGSFYLLANGSSNTGQISTGTMTFGLVNEAGAGFSMISATPQALTNARITFNNIVRVQNNGTEALFTGLGLGSSTISLGTANTSNISFTTSPALTNSILPWAIADATGGPGTDFANYVSTMGVRPLPVGSYSTSINAGSATSNVMVGAAVAPAGASMNSLKMTGGTVDATSGMQITAGALLCAGAGTISGGSILIGTATTSSTTAPTLNVFAVADLNISSRIVNFTPAAGLPSGLAKAGPGVVTLAVSNSYSGPTFVNAGTLRLGHAMGIPNTSEVFVNPGGTLDLNGNSGTIGSLNQTAPSITAGNNIYGTVNIGSVTLTTGVDNNTTSYNGEMLGNGTLVKRGTGTFTLIGSNSFTGTLTVGNGAVVLASHATNGTALANAARINIGSASLDADSVLGFSFGMNNFAVPITTAAPAGRTATLKFINDEGGVPGTTFSSAITLGARGIVIDSAGATTIAGQISGTGSLTTTTTDVVLAGGPSSYSMSITGNNLYTSTTLLTAMATLWGSSTSFGNSTTAVVLGNSNGPDNPELSSSVGGLTLSRPITVNDSLNAVAQYAIIGSRAPANSGLTTYTGTISIPGQRNTAILYSQNPGAGVTFNGPISGGSLASVQVGYSLGSGLEFTDSNVTLNGTSSYQGGTRLVTGTLNLGTNTFGSGSLLVGPVGNGTFTIGTIGLTGAAEPSITATATRTIANPISAVGNFAIRGSNSITFTGTLDLLGSPHVITVATSPISATATFSGPVIGASGSALIKDGGGTLILSASNSYAGPTAVMNGTLAFASTEVLGGQLGIGPDAAAVVQPNGSRTIVAPDLYIDSANGGRLDMNDNELIVDYAGASPINAIVALLKTGYNSGAWTGNGITSTIASTTVAAPVKTALGVAEATDVFSSFPATFAGQSVDNTSVFVRYTAYGDANLSGTVDSIDFNILVANFSGTGKRWSQGDFNYDGSTDSVDFNLLASNFNAIVAAPNAGPSLGALVPEPTSLALLAVTTTMARRRRACVQLVAVKHR